MSTASTTTAPLCQKPLVCSGHSRGVPQLSYSSVDGDGNFYLISACLDGKAMLRIGKTGDWIGTFLGHKGAVWSAGLSHDATKAVTGSADYTAKIWDATNGLELRSVTHKHIVKSVAFSPDSTRIVAGCQDGVIAISDVAKTDATPVILAHQAGCGVKRAIWFDANAIITGSADGVSIWDVRASKAVHRALAGIDVRDLSLGVRSPSATAAAAAAAASASPLTVGDDVLACASEKSVHVLNARDLSVVKTFALSHDVSTVALDCARARLIVGGGSDCAPKVLEYNDGSLRESHKGHHGSVYCVRVAPDAATFASASEDATIRLWQSEIQNYGLWVLPSSSSASASPALTAAATTTTTTTATPTAPAAAVSVAPAVMPAMPAKGTAPAAAMPAAVMT